MPPEDSTGEQALHPDLIITLEQIGSILSQFL